MWYIWYTFFFAQMWIVELSDELFEWTINCNPYIRYCLSTRCITVIEETHDMMFAQSICSSSWLASGGCVGMFVVRTSAVSTSAVGTSAGVASITSGVPATEPTSTCCCLFYPANVCLALKRGPRNLVFFIPQTCFFLPATRHGLQEILMQPLVFLAPNVFFSNT